MADYWEPALILLKDWKVVVEEVAMLRGRWGIVHQGWREYQRQQKVQAELSAAIVLA